MVKMLPKKTSQTGGKNYTYRLNKIQKKVI